MARSSRSSSSYSHDPDYQPCGRQHKSVSTSRRLRSNGGDNQSHQLPKKRIPPKSYNPSSNPTTSHQQDANGGDGGDNQSHQSPKKRIPPKSYNPSSNPTTSRQQDAAHASLTHDDTGGNHYENATRNEIGSSFVDPSLALIHHSVVNKYGDIGRECPLVDAKLRMHILESIYKVVQELQGKTLETLDETCLDTYDLSLRDAEYLKFDVKWLRERLDVLRDGVKSFVETTLARAEEIKLTECIDGANESLKIQKETIEKLKLKVAEQEVELAEKTRLAENLSRKIRCLELKYQHLEGVSLMFGIL